jgi:hypothetical protein
MEIRFVKNYQDSVVTLKYLNALLKDKDWRKVQKPAIVPDEVHQIVLIFRDIVEQNGLDSTHFKLLIKWPSRLSKEKIAVISLEGPLYDIFKTFLPYKK